MTNNIEAFYNMCKSWIIDTRVNNEVEIDRSVDSLSPIAKDKGLKKEDIDNIKNKLYFLN